MPEISDLKFAEWLAAKIEFLKSDPVVLENKWDADAFYDAHEEAILNAQVQGEFTALEALGSPLTRYACLSEIAAKNTQSALLKRLEAALLPINNSIIPPNKQTVVMTKQKVAKLLGRPNKDSGVKWLNNCIRDGIIQYIPMGRLGGIYNIDQVPGAQAASDSR